MKIQDDVIDALRFALDSTDDEGNNKHGIHFDGNEILCRKEYQAEAIADLLDDCGLEYIRTGYYDPEEDKRNNEVDYCTGWYYVNWD